MKHFWSMRGRVGGLVLLLIGWVLPAIAQNNEGLIPAISPLYPQVLETIEQLTPGGQIDVWLATEKEVYQIGEPFEVRFAASQTSYVTFMRIATDGTISFLTPNKQHPDFTVQAGIVYSTGSLTPLETEDVRAYDLGLKLTAGAPAGTEVLNLFCSPTPVLLFDADGLQEALYTIRPDDEERLQALLDRLSSLHEGEWAGSSAAFVVQADRTPAAPKAAAPASRTAPETSTLLKNAPLIPETGTQKQAPRRFGALPPIGATGTTGKSFPAIGATGITTTP